jgi:hypothetical protein
MNSASLCSLAGQYDNPIPPRFLAPIDYFKIPALAGRYDNPIPTRLLSPIDCLKIPALMMLPGKGQQDLLAYCLVAVHVGNQLHHGAEQRAWPVQCTKLYIIHHVHIMPRMFLKLVKSYLTY